MANYSVNSYQSLTDALNKIKNSADTENTITVTGPFSVTSPVTLPAKNITLTSADPAADVISRGSGGGKACSPSRSAGASRSRT